MQFESRSIAWIPRPNRWSLVGLLVSLAVFLPTALPRHRYLGVEGYALLGLLVFGIASAVTRGRPVAGTRHRGDGGSIEIGDRLHIGGRSFDRDCMECGWIDGKLAIVRFRDGTHAVIELADAAGADALVRALRADRRLIAIPVARNASPMERGGFAFLAIGFGVVAVPPLFMTCVAPIRGGAFTAAGLLAAPLGALLFGQWIFIRGLIVRTIRLGTDGVELVGLRRRYISYDELGAVTTYLRDLRLGWLRVPTSSLDEAESIASQIRRARDERTELDPGVEVGPLLREGRAVERWRADLLLLREDPYRGMTDETLATVATHPSARPDARVAAAWALSSARDELRRQVRAATESIADRHLRIALRRAIEGEIDEHALDAAMRRIMKA